MLHRYYLVYLPLAMISVGYRDRLYKHANMLTSFKKNNNNPLEFRTIVDCKLCNQRISGTMVVKIFATELSYLNQNKHASNSKCSYSVSTIQSMHYMICQILFATFFVIYHFILSVNLYDIFWGIKRIEHDLPWKWAARM